MGFIQYFFIFSITISTFILCKGSKDIVSLRQSFPFIGVGLISLLLLLAYYMFFYTFDIDVIFSELLFKNPDSWLVRKTIFLSYMCIYIGIFMQLIVLKKKYQKK